MNVMSNEMKYPPNCCMVILKLSFSIQTVKKNATECFAKVVKNNPMKSLLAVCMLPVHSKKVQRGYKSITLYCTFVKQRCRGGARLKIYKSLMKYITDNDDIAIKL